MNILITFITFALSIVPLSLLSDIMNFQPWVWKKNLHYAQIECHMTNLKTTPMSFNGIINSNEELIDMCKNNEIVSSMMYNKNDLMLKGSGNNSINNLYKIFYFKFWNCKDYDSFKHQFVSWRNLKSDSLNYPYNKLRLENNKYQKYICEFIKSNSEFIYNCHAEYDTNFIITIDIISGLFLYNLFMLLFGKYIFILLCLCLYSSYNITHLQSLHNQWNEFFNM